MNTQDYRLTEVDHRIIANKINDGQSFRQGVILAQDIIIAKFSAARDEKIEAMQKEIDRLKRINKSLDEQNAGLVQLIHDTDCEATSNEFAEWCSENEWKFYRLTNRSIWSRHGSEKLPSELREVFREWKEKQK